MSTHPDADLIELGQQFDQELLVQQPLRAEMNRLFQLFDDQVGQDTASPEAKKARKEFMRKTGYGAAAEAVNKAVSNAMRTMKKIHRTRATTLAGFAVKVRAIQYDFADFDVLRMKTGEDVAEQQFFNLVRDMRAAAAKERVVVNSGEGS